MCADRIAARRARLGAKGRTAPTSLRRDCALRLCAGDRGKGQVGVSARRLLPLLFALGLTACAAPNDYWGRKINELPTWEAFECKQALRKVDRPMILTFCPKGIPYP